MQDGVKKMQDAYQTFCLSFVQIKQEELSLASPNESQ